MGKRDIVIHAYFDVDLDEIWNVIEYDIPKLEEQMVEILGIDNNL